MCGFLGRVGGRADLRHGLPWIANRGPDSQRLWSSSDDRVALLHARLAIVDRDSRAHQPFEDRDAGVTVAMVGEIYNYEELRADLRGYPFATRSDTEVALAAYVRRGVGGLSLLNGMFTLAVVDERNKRVFLVRDAVGKKPLYVAQWNGQVLFGSSVIPLVAIHAGPISVDSEVLEHYWQHAFIQPWRSVIRDVRPVLPGEFVELGWDGSLIRSGRCEPEPQQMYRGESVAESVANVGVLLRQAVTRRLQNNPRPTVLLSGGIDSTVVSSAAADSSEDDHRDSLQALTLGAVIPGTNDEFYARYAARRLSIDMEIMRPHRGGLSKAIVRAFDVQDEPLGMPSFFLLHYLVEAASRYGRVLLTGDGGDEVFLGYRPPSDWFGGVEPRPEKEVPVRVGPGPASWMSPWARQVTGSTLLGHMFAKADRASAEQGVEMRCPLLDWDLFSYVRSLPFEHLSGDNRSKARLKDQLAGWPRWFVERRKLGFTYNLRWRWALSQFDTLRELVDDEAVEMFGDYLPPELNKKPKNWRSRHILRHFGDAWRLLAWSRFLMRLKQAERQQNQPCSAKTLSRPI